MRPDLSEQTLDDSRIQHVHVRVETDADLVAARYAGRTLAESAGFTSSDLTLIATAISELARNIIEYATFGEIVLDLIENDERQGIRILARDSGPGIADTEKAVCGGYSTSGGLGLGLVGVRHIMDEFELQSVIGAGTRVSVIKWKL